MYNYTNRQQAGNRRSRPYSWMLEGQSARDSVMAKRARDQADRDRELAADQYTETQDFQTEQADAAADAAEFGQGAQALTLGSSFADRYGLGGSRMGGSRAGSSLGNIKGWGANDWGGRLGGAVGGAAMGYGIASMVGDRSDKNKKLAGLAGLGMGLMGWI